MENMKLYRALEMARQDALQQEERHKAALKERPLGGWSQEKYEAYHNIRREAARQTANFLFIRMMQINPD